MDSSEYVRRVLEAYRTTHGTCGVVREPDRVLALQLFERGVPLAAVENAFVLAVTRRLVCPVEAPPLSVIRSLAYFSPVIDEVLDSTVGEMYFQYLRHRLARQLGKQ